MTTKGPSSRWWTYKAFSPQGERIKGRLQASSVAALTETLAQKNLRLISCRPGWGRRQKSWARSQDFGAFVAHMAALLKAGFSLEGALEAHEGSPAFHACVRALLESLRQGQAFAPTFREVFGLRDPVACAFLEVGEQRGQLGPGFAALAQSLQEKAEVKNRLVNALSYPLLLLALLMGLLSFLLGEVVPELEKFFLQTGAALPVSSRMLLGFSRDLVGGALPFLGLFLGGLLGLVLLSKATPKGARLVGRGLLKIPFWGSFYLEKECLLFLQSLRLLLASDIPLLQALKTAPAGNASFFQDKIQQGARDILGGSPLSQALARTHLFPPRTLHFIKAGELTGGLPALLGNLVEMLENDLTRKKDRFVRVLEPLSLLLAGGLLAWIVVAFFLPFYEHLTQVSF